MYRKAHRRYMSRENPNDTHFAMNQQDNSFPEIPMVPVP